MTKWDMETSIAEEGSPLTDEARLAFLEEFALAEDLGTKHGLVQRQFVPGTADFWFYDSLCVLLELQTLTEAEDPVKDTEAWGVLSEKKTQLETAEQQLSAAGCWRRMQRLQRRRLLLELELNYRLKKPSTDIASVTQQLTTALQINHLDPEPAGVINNMTKTPFPTTLSEELLDIDKIIEGKLTLLKFDSTRASSLERILQDLDVYAREKTFQKVLLWDGSDDERWELLEVFLDDYAFEYTDIPGYVVYSLKI
ncbi:hypothetical protein BBJ29_004193 [Phytophthora kernoviae]|uniref:Uncharacterized protein n=1 Tax=Phytophthora kernoviae TaxID=325452 RepID=A0A3F2RRZ8_9STRA|nr:hypothetical protein BBJ29_004193 [Phytophthora kernoviae]RLN63051.1 hypothetical protein BBP00_00004366 [Phytophthora kernoviae]